MAVHKEIRQVYVIFKTHLDIGFTDYAQTVVDRYMDTYIPNAIKAGYELKDTKTPFVWTVGSWMIQQALKRGVPMLPAAIRDGIIRWHGLPFTTHTELMSPRLFQYGLSISQELDEQFGMHTIAAKMTDVPGHTIGMVPYLDKAGIRFLHLGVNPATPVPDVPNLFRWKCGAHSIVVMYQGDYGEATVFGDIALEFAHTHDNEGPQNADEICEIYHAMQRKYPNARITAGALDTYAEVVLRVAEHLPVIEKEIGDSWIHGAGTDPKKVSMYRSLLRFVEQHGARDTELADHLLLVPEHTWGMDMKLYFHDDSTFTFDQLQTAKDKRRTIEASWKEQRGYVAKAERALHTTADYDTTNPDFIGFEKTDEKDCGLTLCWQLFDRTDYERWRRDYMRLHVEWSMWDFTRLGLPDYAGGMWTAVVQEAYRKGDKKIYVLRFEDAIASRYGLPYFVVEKEGKRVTVKWFGKRISRLPQAFWLKFQGFMERWELNKMGQWILPEDIVGSPLLSAVWEGVRNTEVHISSLDAPLVAPYGPRLLEYFQPAQEQRQDLYFNLYNNVWSTNFPLWYGEDALFRFVIDNRQPAVEKIRNERRREH